MPLPRRQPGKGRSARRLVLMAALAATALVPRAHAGDDASVLEASQHAVGGMVGDRVLRDGAGASVSLDTFRGRPLVVNLVYTSCYGSCSFLTRRLAQAVAVARDAVGADSFNVITVGFDAPADSAERMADYARKQRIGDAHWQVLNTDPETARALARDLGFTFVASPRGFDHVSQVSVVDASGRVYRQIYGEGFPTPALVEPLKELVWGTAASAVTVGGWLSGLKLLCTVYDPSTDRYRFDYSVFVGAFVGLLCLGALAVFLVRSWSDSSRHRPAG